ncbi:hypothetical protein J1605_002170 [Eschrichtius robustus]|uniref:Uncharacterized protein n=1 Tax=Eschrichtius robustus TaxID=9764 RepID=A0AB34HZM2_ESCRO|nr:hypothetical protein J1605_002170 [Eschrichtius robustus]
MAAATVGAVGEGAGARLGLHHPPPGPAARPPRGAGARRQTASGAAPQPPQPPATTATPQPQYVTELQSPQPQAQPPGGQKQYVTELPATPTPSQPAGTPAPSPASQQYIVVTVSAAEAQLPALEAEPQRDALDLVVSP